MPDPCHKCGANVFAGALECSVCQAPIERLSAAQRAERSRGPKLIAALTLAGVGVAILLAATYMGDTHYSRRHFTIIGLGFAFIGAAIKTWWGM